MAGEPLARAQELARRVVAGLGPADRVGLVTFADGVSTTRFVAGDRAGELRNQIDHLRAHGRSNLEAALDEAAQLLRGAQRPLVVLMTDGQPTVGESDQPAATREDFRGARMVVAHFNYPSRKAALERLFPSLTMDYVPDGPAGDEAVARLARVAVAPTIDDVKLELIGAAQIEGAIPARLATGEAIRLMARADADVTVRLSGRLHDRPFQIEQRVPVTAAPDGRGDRGLPVEWARLRARGLETRLDGSGTPDEKRSWAEEIRGLGKTYGLMTRFTSFVVTDSLSPDRIKPGDPELRIHAPRSAQAVRALLPWG